MDVKRLLSPKNPINQGSKITLSMTHPIDVVRFDRAVMIRKFSCRIAISRVSNLAPSMRVL